MSNKKTISVKSRKAKARTLQKWVKQQVENFTNIPSDKIRCALMGETGSDIKIDKDWQHNFPFAVECKNAESFNAWRAWQQAITGITEKNQMPIVFTKKNGLNPMVFVDAKLFMELWSYRYKQGI